MPPDALRKLVAYSNTYTHWTERVEHLLLHLVYYTVNMNQKPGCEIDIVKFRPPTERVGGGGGSRGASKAQTPAEAERVAAAYGQHL